MREIARHKDIIADFKRITNPQNGGSKKNKQSGEILVTVIIPILKNNKYVQMKFKKY